MEMTKKISENAHKSTEVLVEFQGINIGSVAYIAQKDGMTRTKYKKYPDTYRTEEQEKVEDRGACGVRKSLGFL
jgi:hypothetical protein